MNGRVFTLRLSGQWMPISCRLAVALVASVTTAVACVGCSTQSGAAIKADRPVIPRTPVSAPGAVGALAAARVPTVLSVPSDGGRVPGGTTVTVLGSGFRRVKGVKFGTAAGTRVEVLSSVELTVTAPAHVADTVDIRVSTAMGISAVSARDRYTYQASPTISSVSPSDGPTAGGTVVTVYGSGFSNVRSVMFGSAAGSVVKVLSGSELTVASPAHAAGTVDIRVRTQGGRSAVSAHDRYTYDIRPAVSSVSPNTGSSAGGTSVTVHGSGFTGVTSVLFGAAAGSQVNVVSGSELTVISPAQPAGTVDVQVTTPGGTSEARTTEHYTYVLLDGPVASVKAQAVTATGVTLTWFEPVQYGL